MPGLLTERPVQAIPGIIRNPVASLHYVFVGSDSGRIVVPFSRSADPLGVQIRTILSASARTLL